MKKLLLVALMILGLSGLANAAQNINQTIVAASSQSFGVYATTGNQSSNGCINQSVLEVGGTVIRGIAIGSAGTAQCVMISDVSSCTPNGITTGVFESCAAANTSTYFDFSNAPIKIKNGITVSTSRSDGFMSVYTP